MNAVRIAILVATTVTTGVMAGIYVAFSIAVMPGLGRGDDHTFVVAMQHTNRAILNGWFALVFGGSAILMALAVVLYLGAGDRRPLAWVAAALVLYVATLVITFAVNVPLNDALDAAGDPDGGIDLAAVRSAFEPNWIRWNIVRATGSAAALACLAWALVLAGRS